MLPRFSDRARWRAARGHRCAGSSARRSCAPPRACRRAARAQTAASAHSHRQASAAAGAKSGSRVTTRSRNHRGIRERLGAARARRDLGAQEIEIGVEIGAAAHQRARGPAGSFRAAAIFLAILLLEVEDACRARHHSPATTTARRRRPAPAGYSGARDRPRCAPSPARDSSRSAPRRCVPDVAVRGLSRNEDERATTPSPRTPVSATAISSVIPPAKKSCVASPELFSSGSTATVGRAAPASAPPRMEAPVPSASAVTAATHKCRVGLARSQFMVSRSRWATHYCTVSEVRISISSINPRPEERALARVSKDGHSQDRARVQSFETPCSTAPQE